MISLLDDILTPLWKYLGGYKRSEVPTLCKRISPLNAVETAKFALSMGHDSLKLKIGFDQNSDVKIYKRIKLFAWRVWKTLLDANQSWNT